MGKFFNKESQVLKGTAIGAGVGAAMGAASGEKSKGKSALKGAIAGGLAGAGIGLTVKGMRQATAGGGRQRAGSSGRPYTQDLNKDLSNLGIKNKKKVKTKLEVKKAFRRKSMKHHPDRGGDTDRMASINNS